MSTDFLFSGADPTAKEDLLPLRPAGFVSKGPAEVIARTAMTVTFALASICGAPTVAFAHMSVDKSADIAPVTIDETRQRILTLRSEGEPPSDKSRLVALDLVSLLRARKLEPDRILADLEGGVALYIFGERASPGGSHSRYARLVATNSGEVAILCADRTNGPPRVWDVKPRELAAAVDSVLSFVNDE